MMNKQIPSFHLISIYQNLYDYIWGDERDSLPVLNPMSTERLLNIAGALENHIKTNSFITSPVVDINPATIKQSGQKDRINALLYFASNTYNFSDYAGG